LKPLGHLPNACCAGPAMTTPVSTYAFRCTTARRPEREELNVLRSQLAEQRRRYSASPADAARVVTNGESLPDSSLPLGELAAWTMVSNLVLNLDEAVARN
jgi:hypothetical protein